MTRRTKTAARRGVRRRRGGWGALSALAGLLLVSAVIRIGIGAAMAIEEIGQPAEAEIAQTPASCAPGAGALAMLAELRAREERLALREAAAADRAQALALARGQIDMRLQDLVAAEEKLASTVAIADQAADKDVAVLVAVYEQMKPKEAARLFEAMEPTFAAGFLARMRPDAAAAVMSGLAPENAYRISVLLAGRNARAPKS